MLYRYGLRLGVDLLARRSVKHAARFLVIPVNYWRNVEYDLICDACRFQSNDRVLDIGSPKLLSLYLAEKFRAEVFATDIEDYFVQSYHTIRSMRRVPPNRLHLRVEDGRNLSFEDGYFSKVYSLSVIEHIPGDGDSECAAEIGRVLAPGGRCAITVPFARRSRDEYKDASRFYWARASHMGEAGPVFYQRRYSETDLFKRIIEPSRLKVRALRYVGERVLTTSRRELCEFMPKPTGPIQPLLSNLFLTAPVDSWQALKKPLCALLVLEK